MPIWTARSFAKTSPPSLNGPARLGWGRSSCRPSTWTTCRPCWRSAVNILSYCYPLVGLQPEEVDASWEEALRRMRDYLSPEVIGIGECGLDFYWSREHEQEQLKAFEEQVRWSVETRLPLMIHCRKAQQEMISILRKYEEDLPLWRLPLLHRQPARGGGLPPLPALRTGRGRRLDVQE